MSVQSSARTALSPLPVNTFGSPSARNLSLKESLPRKRLIEDVEAPEDSPPPQRKCVSRTEATPPVVSVTGPQEDEVGRLPPVDMGGPVTHAKVQAFENPVSTPEWSPITGEPQSPGSATMDADARPNSPRASVASSVLDYDPDDTMESLQTAATEVTQQSQPRISQQLETLRLRLRLANFKVQTNQTNVPFAQLRLSRASVSPLPLPDDKGRAPTPEPIPSLSPTQSQHQSRDEGRQDDNVPSSSPPASSPSRQDRHDYLDEISRGKSKPSEYQTPELPRHRVSIQPQSTAMPRVFRDEDERLTSSALRGKAAIGLLGLRGELQG